MSVDLSKILASAKSFMDAEDSGQIKPKTTMGGGNLPSGFEMYDEDYEPPKRQMQEIHPSGLRIAEGASKLPKQIRDSILNNPTPTEREMMVLLDPVAKAEQALMKEQQSKRNVRLAQQPNIGGNEDLMLVSKSELKTLMLETLLEFMPKITTQIEESAIKKTIQVIIKENKEKKGRV